MKKIFNVASWNINSLKVRLPQVLYWLEKHNPDVMALQETKIQDHQFPTDKFNKLGYHTIFSGQKTYNGVAILSKHEIDSKDIVTKLPGLQDEQKRLLGATIKNFRILNLYIPNGENMQSPKYEYKLKWLNKLNDYISQQIKMYKNLIVLGDFNIAPQNCDVYDAKAWEGRVLFSELEHQALSKIMDQGLKDSFRLFEQQPNSFSWWDYRSGAFRRNAGLRIDLILTNTSLAQTCKISNIDKTMRGLKRPSDHAPVIAGFYS